MTNDINIKHIFELYCNCTLEQKIILDREIKLLLNNYVIDGKNDNEKEKPNVHKGITPDGKSNSF